MRASIITSTDWHLHGYHPRAATDTFEIPSILNKLKLNIEIYGHQLMAGLQVALCRCFILPPRYKRRTCVNEALGALAFAL